MGFSSRIFFLIIIFYLLYRFTLCVSESVSWYPVFTVQMNHTIVFIILTNATFYHLTNFYIFHLGLHSSSHWTLSVKLFRLYLLIWPSPLYLISGLTAGQPLSCCHVCAKQSWHTHYLSLARARSCQPLFLQEESANQSDKGCQLSHNDRRTHAVDTFHTSHVHFLMQKKNNFITEMLWCKDKDTYSTPKKNDTAEAQRKGVILTIMNKARDIHKIYIVIYSLTCCSE